MEFPAQGSITIFVTPSRLSRQVLYIAGASSRVIRCEMMLVGSISLFSNRASRSGKRLPGETGGPRATRLVLVSSLPVVMFVPWNRRLATAACFTTEMPHGIWRFWLQRFGEIYGRITVACI